MSTDGKSVAQTGFYNRDNRWLVSIDNGESLVRGDLVEVARKDGRIRIMKIQDEVIVESGRKDAKRYYLAKDETELVEQGYVPHIMIRRYRPLNGAWWGLDIERTDTVE